MVRTLFVNLHIKRRTLNFKSVYRHLSEAVMDTKKLRLHGKEIFNAGLESMKPKNLISNAVKIENNNSFSVSGTKFYMPKSICVVGFGKAVTGMAKIVEDLFGDRISRGILSVPFGTVQSFRDNCKLEFLPTSRIQIFEGAKNNLPDEDSFYATKHILDMMSQVRQDELILVLISGGGSALLSYPKHPVTLEEKRNLIQQLSSKGAAIEELNCVRKRLSVVKGGGLAQHAHPNQVVSLILSDVIGDPLDLIASSPTVENNDRPEEALHILQKYLALDSVPKAIISCITTEEGSKRKKTGFDHIHNFLIGTNKKALEASKSYAEQLGYSTFILSSILRGEASAVGRTFAHLANYIICMAKNGVSCSVTNEDIAKGFDVDFESIQHLVGTVAQQLTLERACCILSGGETTVAVKGTGKGGRNQEMSLSFAAEADEKFTKAAEDWKVLFLSAGTDGIDGPTDAAGAVAYLGMVKDAKKMNLDLSRYLKNNDSYSFYRAFNNGHDHVISGHTGTNVMDLQILLIHPKL